MTKAAIENINSNNEEIYHRTLLTYGMAESSLSELIEPWELALPKDIKLAYLPDPITGIKLRLSIYGCNRNEAETRINKEIETLTSYIADNIYGEGEDSLQSVIGEALNNSNSTLAIAESCTGGKISSLITSVSGASQYYLGSVTAYDNSIKQNVLSVPSSVIENYGAVSKECVEAMSKGVLKLFNSDYAIATSGITGPTGGTPEKPVGTLWVSIAQRNKQTGEITNSSQKFTSNSSRNINSDRFAYSAINKLRLILKLVSSNSKKQAALEELNTMMSSIYNPNEPGAAILIMDDKEVIFDKGYGLADLKKSTVIDGNTFFNIASISKQFSAVAIIKLAEEGKLSLDDKVKKFFPEFKSDIFDTITLRHLLSHTSGIGDYRPRTDMNFVLYCTDVDSYQYMKELDTLHFTPGTEYEYMNPTYQLFYTIIEQISGETFEEYMRNHIFTPSNMKNTLYFSPDKNIPNMAHGYISIGNFKEYDYGEETFFATKADGGIYSSTREFAEWEKTLRNNTLISSDQREEAHSPKITVSGSKYSSYQNRPYTSYGYGWFIDDNPNSPKKIYHTGDNGGFQNYAGRYTDKNVLVVIFSNRNDHDRWELVTKVEEILVKGEIL